MDVCKFGRRKRSQRNIEHGHKPQNCLLALARPAWSRCCLSDRPHGMEWRKVLATTISLTGRANPIWRNCSRALTGKQTSARQLSSSLISTGRERLGRSGSSCRLDREQHLRVRAGRLLTSAHWKVNQNPKAAAAQKEGLRATRFSASRPACVWFCVMVCCSAISSSSPESLLATCF